MGAQFSEQPGGLSGVEPFDVSVGEGEIDSGVVVVGPGLAGRNDFGGGGRVSRMIVRDGGTEWDKMGRFLRQIIWILLLYIRYGGF